MKEARRFLDSWKKRDIVLDREVPAKGSLDDYGVGTPERTTIQFLNYWRKGNYGGIAKQIAYSKKYTEYSKEAGRIRGIFKDRVLKEYELVSIEDCAPAISEIMLKVKFEYKKTDFDKVIKFRMIYQNEEGESVVFGQNGAEWKLIDSYFFHQIEFPDI